MIHSTRELFAKLESDKRKLRNVTTKTIDASIKVTKPKKGALKPTMLTTRGIGSADDIAEKKKRIKITEDRKKAAKKKVKIVGPSAELLAQIEAIGEPQKTKKPWKEMTKKERSAEMKRRAQVARINKAKKEAENK